MMGEGMWAFNRLGLRWLRHVAFESGSIHGGVKYVEIFT